MSAVLDSAPDLRSGIGAWTHIVEPLFHATTVPMTEWGGDSLVGAAVEWKKAQAIADAQQVAAMALLARLQVADARAMELTRQNGSTYRISLAQAQEQAVAFTAAEFAPALNMTRGFAQTKVEEAIALFNDRPEVWASLNRGEISGYQARIITEEVACLDPDKAAHVVDEHLVPARGYTPAKLRKALRHAVLKADPEAAMRRCDQARKKRRVTARVVEDAMGWFSAFVTAAEMTELMGTVDAYARMLPADEGRTLDNRRADALVGLIRRGGGLQPDPTPAVPNPAATDAPSPPSNSADEPVAEPAEATAADEPADIVDPFEQQLAAESEALPASSRRPEGNPIPTGTFSLKPKVDVRVIIQASTLLGWDNEPGYLDGCGPIPAQIARGLAADGTWRRMLTDRSSGTLLDLGRTQYPPSMPLRENVQERDQTCRFPGCERKATACEIDHVIPWPVGTTSIDNCACLCAFHHRLKTFGGWKLKLDANGACTWTSPAGLQYVTRPPKPGGISPPTEALQRPTIPSRKTLLRKIAGLSADNTTNAAGEPPF
jgi:hypothetical protein